jgi:hypothetical protein
MSAEDKESFLSDDPEIASQRWCLLSFLSPEAVLNRKEQFFFTTFLNQYEFQLRSKKMEEFLVKQIQSINNRLDDEAVKLEALDLSGAAAACRKSTLSIEPFVTSFQTFVKGNLKDLTLSKMKEEYEDFMFQHSVKLEDEFYAKNNFQTSMRGLKIRGSYGQKEEAEVRAKKLQKMDPDHNIYVGQVGKWLPWDPSPSAIPDQEYAEDQLNTLMKKYKENEEAREVFHKEQRDRARKGGKGVMNMDGNEAQSDYNSSKNLSVSKAEADTTEDTSVPSLGTGSSSFEGMFSGPADLAIQRKMDREKK